MWDTQRKRIGLTYSTKKRHQKKEKTQDLKDNRKKITTLTLTDVLHNVSYDQIYLQG